MADLTREEVLDFLMEWANAYDSADDAFFDFFAPNASFFGLSSPTRIDGVAAFRRGFYPYFKGHTRRSQLLAPEVNLFGNSAAVSLHSRILVDGRVNNLQTSMVIARDDQGNPKIVLLHNSPMSVPAIPPSMLGVGARSFEDISLLEERIATAAAVVGTPK